MDRLSRLRALASRDGVCSARTLREKLRARGTEPDDGRLRHTWQELSARGDGDVDLDLFRQIVGPELLMVERVLNQQLIVPGWQSFRLDIQQIFEKVAADRSGANADSIPILRDADPEPSGRPFDDLEPQPDRRPFNPEIAFRVACADGSVEIEEERKRRALAGALGIGEGVPEMERETFRRTVTPAVTRP